MNENNYFTGDVQAAIREMSNDEMNDLLLGLESMPEWVAILKYSQARMLMGQSSLMTIDPIAHATDMCRAQGTLIGLSDLQNMVIMLKEKAARNTPPVTK